MMFSTHKIEKNITIVLNTVRDNPNITMKQLQKKLVDNPNTPSITKTILRTYILHLFKRGFIQKSGVHTRSYKVITNKEYTYSPINKYKGKVQEKPR